MDFHVVLMKSMTLLCIVLLSSFAVSGQGITGDWEGSLNLGGGRALRLVFHVSADDSSVAMDSPDQGAYGIEGETIFLSADSICFSVPKIMMDYAGHRDGDVIAGTFRQGGMSLPLEMRRTVIQPMKRPQTPQPPFPYKEEEVRIDNPDGQSVLAGTLTVPDNYTRETPVVVLATGSGLQNRDEELFGHRPFAVIADYLARHGIASLRCDDRGIGGSTGDVVNATTEDFASDVRAALDWVRGQKRFGKAGIIGHSEGGIIAYMLGKEKSAPDFIISIAGPSVKGTKILAYQNKEALKKTGISDTMADDFGKAVERAFEYRLVNPVPETVSADLLASIYPQHTDGMLTQMLANSVKSLLTTDDANPWMRFYLAYDPADDLSRLSVPAFIIYGEKDRQVPPSLNADVARQTASKAIVKVYPGLNHLMQHASTGAIEEYPDIEETISPDLLSDIAAFITTL